MAYDILDKEFQYLDKNAVRLAIQRGHGYDEQNLAIYKLELDLKKAKMQSLGEPGCAGTAP